MYDKEFEGFLKALTAYTEALAEGSLQALPSEMEAVSDGNLKKLYENMKKLEARMASLMEEAAKAVQYAEAIRNDNELLVELLSKRNEWLLVVDSGNKEILYCNKRKMGADGTDTVCAACKKRLSFHSELLDWEDENGRSRDQYHVWEIDEGNVCYRITSFPVEWKERDCHVHIVVDVTDEKQTARTLTSKAYHDLGTGIKNRLFFKEYMESVLTEKKEATLCYLDLDGLKYVNDTFGHLEGDNYIQNFVEMIRSSFRNDDTFARTGGDEFCLVLTGRIKDLIERKMAEILDAFQSTHYAEYQCSFSYGIVEIAGKDNEWTLDEILNQADAAMYECKRRNKEKYPSLVR